MTDELPEAEKFKITQAADAAIQFSKIYYENYDKKRQTLEKLYLDNAALIWNGNYVDGRVAIQNYLQELPETANTTVECVDCHPLPDALTQGQTTMVVVVMGNIKYQTSKPRSTCFSQTFIMTTQTTGGHASWKIAKDCFRLLG